MRLFNGAVEAVKEVERDLWEMGHKTSSKSYQDKEGTYESKEIVGHSFLLTDGDDWAGTFRALGFKDEKECQEYVLLELDERWAGGLNPGESWKVRPEVWKHFLEYDYGDIRYLDRPFFSYTYSHRLTHQVKDTLQLLFHDQGSRQAVLPIYDKRKDEGYRAGTRRVPCTMHFQVLIRKPTIYLIHSMRSCDLYTHFPIDMSVSWLMLKKLRDHIESGLQPQLIMQFGSLHAFRKDLEPRGIF